MSSEFGNQWLRNYKALKTSYLNLCRCGLRNCAAVGCTN